MGPQFKTDVGLRSVIAHPEKKVNLAFIRPFICGIGDAGVIGVSRRDETDFLRQQPLSSRRMAVDRNHTPRTPCPYDIAPT
jgi:hypothetical protein